MKILFLNIEQCCAFVGLKSNSLHSCYGRCQVLHSPQELLNALSKLLSAKKHTRRCNILFDKSLLNSTESFFFFPPHLSETINEGPAKRRKVSMFYSLMQSEIKPCWKPPSSSQGQSVVVC